MGQIFYNMMIFMLLFSFLLAYRRRSAMCEVSLVKLFKVPIQRKERFSLLCSIEHPYRIWLPFQKHPVYSKRALDTTMVSGCQRYVTNIYYDRQTQQCFFINLLFYKLQDVFMTTCFGHRMTIIRSTELSCTCSYYAMTRLL